MKVIILYESRYGNTEKVAENIIMGINEIGEIATELSEIKKFNFDNLYNYDAILIGSPIHFGGPTRGVKKFIDKLGKISLKGKFYAVFDTYTGKDFEKAVKKMEKRIDKKNPELNKMFSGLSIKVAGYKGPILGGQLAKSREFGKKIALFLMKYFLLHG